MSAALAPPPVQTALAQIATFRRFTVAEYHEMIRAGVLTTEDRVELIDGYLVNKMPQNDPHASTVQRLTKKLVRAVPLGWEARIQLPISIGNSEPEPDGAVVRGDDRTYDGRRPTGTDFGAVIEIADSSLGLDQRFKMAEYAAADIPAYWIVNVRDNMVEAYTDPDPAGRSYRTRTDYRPGDGVPLVLDGVEVACIPVADLLP
jgi:Uma2 family endonuclease